MLLQGVFRVKNYLKILPTYKVLWNRKVWGISSNKCPRCSIETETWEHIWICGKNDVNNTEYEIFVEEVLNKEITRGLFNIKWWQACKLKDQRKILNEIFDVYMQKIQRLIWNNRCSDTIDLEQQLGIIKELKRKNKKR
ncbi:hypothetical protein RhiirA1_475479 [Rhizophagus irregularis]|uniref:Uncharacterized protein n=1 Tax=Rhizophagus irregularis TaxID=588596 RepID=A0A2I1EXW3_9GLOM|nr:hypothetical protein RhiirA1_475479 [Rhizophagus irregularis]PKY26956.1 hypothetical protein RhiirB3_442463 [Rhizophagus irregularis]